VELRPRLDAVISEQRPVELRSVSWRSPSGQDRFFDVHLTPLLGDDSVIGTSVAYIDVTEAKDLQVELISSKREVEQAYEELQSTVEELETTNEELQSTNEELETMNEELHSSNEELETMNEELRHRSQELNDLNSFLETILSTIGHAVAVLDRQQRIQVWSDHARELWGLTQEETEDQHLLSLDFGLPVEQLKSLLRAALDGSTSEQTILEATNRRGKSFLCRVTCRPLGGDHDGSVSGVIVMMEAVEE
jgi:two-component system CheB/CheR fusion protein